MQLYEYEKRNDYLDPEDVAFLNKHHSGHLKTEQISKNEVQIKAGHFVGRISLPSGKNISIRPKININNLLYIISYTYGLVSFKHTERLKTTENDALIQIYIIVLLNWVENLLKKGLYKSYQTYTEDLSGIRGKIKIKENLTRRSKLVCEYDDITFSNFENRIIKSTLLFVINKDLVDINIRQRALIYYRLLKEISLIQLSKSCFKKVNITRLNSYYLPVIELCELIYKNLRLSDTPDDTLFSGYMVNMNEVFERFLLKSLQNRIKDRYVTKSSKRDWANFATDNHLPQIEPDILVKDTAILDAKYYKTPFTSNDKYMSSHSYQIITYLTAYKIRRGFLVYPEPDDGRKIDSSYILDNMAINMYSIPLNSDISHIESSLDKLAERVLAADQVSNNASG